MLQVKQLLLMVDLLLTKENIMGKRVVITGMGVVTPLGNTVDELWENLINGVSGIDRIKSFDTEKFSIDIAAEVKEFDSEKYMDRKEAKKLPKFLKFAINSAMDAFTDSGIDIESYGADDVAVIYGSGIGGISFTEENTQKCYNKGPKRVSPFYIPYSIVDMTSGLISIKTGAKGANYAVVSACASSGNAIGVSYMTIKSGMAKAVITGGTEAAVTPLAVAGFTNLQALGTSDDPKTASRPFDKTRNGFIMGEGAASLILEDYETAKARGAKIYGEIVGVGMTGDAYHITSPDPQGDGGAKAIKQAIKNVDLSEIGYINAHGTSTLYNDKFETIAIKKALGEDVARQVNISSTKSMHGHMLGSAGAVEAIISVLSIDKGIIPPTINLNNPDPDCDLNYTPNKAVKREYKVALSNSLGFGGHNATIAIRKMD